MAGVKKPIPKEMAQNVSLTLAAIVRDNFAGNQRKAAEALGMSAAHLSNLLAGIDGRGPGLTTLIAMSDFTNRSIDDILGRHPKLGDRWVDMLRSTLRRDHPLAMRPRPLPSEPNFEKRLILRAKWAVAIEKIWDGYEERVRRAQEDYSRSLEDLSAMLDGIGAELPEDRRLEADSFNHQIYEERKLEALKARTERIKGVFASMGRLDKRLLAGEDDPRAEKLEEATLSDREKAVLETLRREYSQK